MGGSSSSSSSHQQTDNYAWDNRAAGTGHAITATSGAVINSTTTDAGTVKAATDLVSKALDMTGSGFDTYANKLGDIVDKAMGVAVTTQQNAQDFAVAARMDAQTSQLVKIMPWIVGGAAVAFIMARA